MQKNPGRSFWLNIESNLIRKFAESSNLPTGLNMNSGPIVGTPKWNTLVKKFLQRKFFAKSFPTTNWKFLQFDQAISIGGRGQFSFTDWPVRRLARSSYCFIGYNRIEFELADSLKFVLLYTRNSKIILFVSRDNLPHYWFSTRLNKT